MKIFKFGGSSIQTPDRTLHVIDLVLNAYNHHPLGVVFSAFGGVTNQLIQMSQQCVRGDENYADNLHKLESNLLEFNRQLIQVKHQSKIVAQLKSMLNTLEDLLHGVYLIQELSPRTLDYIMSYGEQFSCTLLHAALSDRGISTRYLDTRTVVKTDNHFGAARVNFELTNQNIRTLFNDNTDLTVITGFIGSTAENETTTLGRSGSDYTASIFGAALQAEEIVIWTDVNGIMTADPRKVPTAFSRELITYDEAMEMSHFGAKVIHPSAMQPAFESQIPLRITNTFQPEFQGTLISGQRPDSGQLISGVSSIENIALLRLQGAGMMGVPGISARLFSVLAQANINIILITQASSEHTICFAISPEDARRAEAAIRKEFALEMEVHRIDDVIVEENLSIIAAVGENMRHTPGIAGRFFQVLGKHSINVVAIAQGSSELNISVVVEKDDEHRALNAIHAAFFQIPENRVNLFIAGAGLIGTTLLHQLNTYNAGRKTHLQPLRVIGIANSHTFLIDQEGVDTGNWEKRLNSTENTTGSTGYIPALQSLDQTNTIFVDCTASEQVADQYDTLLRSRISVVAANKIANSGRYQVYSQLQKLTESGEVHFRYETNVGAGLPVIQSIKNLRATGDKVRRIDAVLSGTLSYIFNQYDGSRGLSELITLAREKGFTEPDPRDDLDGKDVARKLLILARESGIALELEDIDLQPVVPEKYFQTASADEFINELAGYDTKFLNTYHPALDAGKVLRYIATFTGKYAGIQLQTVDANHPFYHLNGSDNIVAITTDRYPENPLIIRGPGAGPEVTAAGVFADILSIANHMNINRGQ